MSIATLSYSDGDGHHSLNLDREETSLGRSGDRDLILKDQCVSRHHASIFRSGNVYTLIDQKSTHGTFLNGAKVQQTELHFGDMVQLGSLHGPRLHFQPFGEDEATRTAPVTPATKLLTSLSELQATEGENQPSARNLEKLNWLLRASRMLNEGPALEGVLSAFLHLTLQLTSFERAFVFLECEGQMKLAKGLGSSGELLREDSTVSRRAMRGAIESASKFSISDALADADAANWPSVVANQLRSICCIPLRKRASATEAKELLGLVYLDSRRSLADLTKVDEQLLDTIAAEAASLVHNALLAEAESKAREAREELAVAARIHGGLMAMALPKLPFAEICAQSIPCLAIGGDFYDVVSRDGRVYVNITDVSGKGVSAAIVAATLQGIIHSEFLAQRSLVEIAELLNQFLCSRNIGKYATTVLLKLCPDGALEYVNCGHVQPILLRNGELRRLEEGNLIVGLIAAAQYGSSHFVLEPGDRLLLTTDGLTEAEDPQGQQFADIGLDASLCCEGLNAILERVQAFRVPNLAQDDCTLVEIRYTGVPQ